MSGDMIQRMAVAPAGPHALYGLDKLARAKPDAPVLLVEGENTADAAQRLFPEHICMAWGNDALSAGRADYSPLRGRNVIIWPTNETISGRAARNAEAMLKKAGAYPLLLPLPDSLPVNWSLADVPPEDFDPRAYLGRAGLPPVRLPVVTADDAIRPWPVLHPDALPGLAGEFVSLATQGSEVDPAAVLITFLVRFGVEVYGFAPGKGPYVRVGETRHPPRLYTVIAGASSRARKGTSAKPVLRLYEDIPVKWRHGAPIAPYTGGPLSSGEGLAFRLRERDEDGVDSDKSENQSEQHEDKRLCVLDEEFAAAIASTKREGNTLSMAVRSFWDSGNYEPLTKTAQVRVRDAHVGIVTHITIREVRRNLDAMQIANGFANRFIWACARRSKLVACPEPIPEDAFTAFQDKLWERIRLAQARSEVPLTAGAKSFWQGAYPEISKDRPGAGGDITARGEAHCLRLALVYALLDGADRIGPEHLWPALALWQYAQDSALYIFGNGEEESLLGKVLFLLQSGPKSTTELNALLGGHVPSRKMRDCLQELIGCGLIVKQELKTGGRPKIVYEAAEKAE